MSQDQKRRTKKPGEPDAPDTFVSLERPDVSGVLEDLDTAEKRADEMMKKQKTGSEDLICWCGNPRCCNNLGRPFVDRNTGKSVPRRIPRYCA